MAPDIVGGAPCPARRIMVDFRITWILPIGEVSKPRLLGLKNLGYDPVGAVSNRTESARPDKSGTVPTKHEERKCLFIFRIHHK